MRKLVFEHISREICLFQENYRGDGIREVDGVAPQRHPGSCKFLPAGFPVNPIHWRRDDYSDVIKEKLDLK